MRAALLEKNQEPLAVVNDIVVEDPRPGEVLVKVSHCGICHSDLTVVDMPGGGQLHDLAKEVLAIARSGLAARGRLNTSGDNETGFLETLDEIERTSIDFYATIRSLYHQRRQSEIRNGSAPSLPKLDVSIDTDEDRTASLKT